MKIIDILNEIAGGTLKDEVIIEYNEIYYKYNKEDNSLRDEDGYSLSEVISVEKGLNDEVILYKKTNQIEINTINDEVEKVEEIEELTRYAGAHIDVYDKSDIDENRAKINELVRVVNKLIKEK